MDFKNATQLQKDLPDGLLIYRNKELIPISLEEYIKPLLQRIEKLEKDNKKLKQILILSNGGELNG